jgi:hypothetical protein
VHQSTRPENGRGRSRRVRLLSTVAGVCVAGVGLAQADAVQPFTVMDSVQWTHVLSLSEGSRYQADDPSLFSPDGASFLLRTANVDFRRNAILDRLLLFDTRDVRSYLANGRSAPMQSRELIAIPVDRESGRLRDVRWLGDKQVAFLAQGANGVAQSFVVSLDTGVVRQMTHSMTPVVSCVTSGARTLYYAYAPVPASTVSAAVGTKTISDVLFSQDVELMPLNLLSTRGQESADELVSATPVELLPSFHGIWLSPAGDRAITFVPAARPPAYWAEYQVTDYDRLGYKASPALTDESSNELIFKTRYAIVDLATGKSMPLLDAPSGWLAQNLTPIRAFWRDASHVIVSNSYLPLSDAVGAERERRRKQPAVAEIDLETGRVTPIFWEPALTDAERRAGKRFPFVVSDIDWDPKHSRITLTKRVRNPTTSQVRYEKLTLAKRGQAWREESLRSTESTSRPSITLRESLNERPRVFASDGDRSREIFDPNPQSDFLTFGRTEVTTWTDEENQVTWTGGLTYPVQYVAGRKFPLIVQSHGFDPSRFMLDGPQSPGGGMTAMATQAFANAGFLVAQLEDNARAFTADDAEGPRFAAGAKALIDNLVERGLVDADNVGFIGFSRTGFHALHLLARYPHLLKAATIADSVQAGYVEGYVLSTNAAPDAIAEVRRMGGGAVASAQMGELFKRHPLYRLGDTSAAVRLEANSLNSALGLWETYSVLANAGRRVDMVYFPEGSHVQFRPKERLASQGGNVDWFRFWLQGYERISVHAGSDETTQSLAGQYARWRQLRDAHRP